ncbi:MAG: histidine kinase [Salinisphaeraceae bacterium]|nr:histidine kinase [Salinisphaeraceae bacterium]
MTAHVTIKETRLPTSAPQGDETARLKASQEREQWLLEHFQALSHYLLVEQEAERRKLSRILHDNIGQSLTAAIINLQTAQMSDEGLDTETLQQTCQTLSDCLSEIREMELNLRPSQLDDLGLKLAVEAYLERSLSGSNVEYRLQDDELEGRLDPRLETAAFRIVQDSVQLCRSLNIDCLLTIRLGQDDKQLHIDIRCQLLDENQSSQELMDNNKILGMRERTAMLMGHADMQFQEHEAHFAIHLPLKTDPSFSIPE